MDDINENLTPEQTAGIEAQDVTEQNVVDVDVLEADPVPVPEQPVSNNAGGRVISLAETALQAREQEKAQAEVARKEAIELQKEVNDSENLIRTLSGETQGRGEAQATAIADSGLNETQKGIDNLDNQILALTTSIGKQEIQDGLQVSQLAGRGLGIPAGIVRGQQALLAGQLKAKRDSSSLDLANKIATSALLQGKVEDAKTAIEEKIKLEFEDKENELALEMQFLSRSDTKEARARERAIELEERTIEEQKAAGRQIFNIQAQVAQAGGSQAEIQAVGQATTPEQALSLAPSLGSAFLLDMQLKRLNINSKSLDIKQQQAVLDELANPQSDIEVKPDFTNATFAQRIEDANAVLDVNIKDVGDITTQILTLGGRKNSETRQRKQAQRNFVNAVLRNESGAAIAPDEFESAKEQYFPKITDDKKTVAQKKRNREVVLQGMILSSGGAYEQLKTTLEDGTPNALLDSFNNEESSEDFLADL